VTDKDPIDGIANDVSYQTAGDAEAGLIGAYNALLVFEYMGLNYLALTEVNTDNVTYTGNDVNYVQLDNNNAAAENTVVADLWDRIFRGVNWCNYLIVRVPGIQDPAIESVRNRILGEAYFLRAFHYHTLVNIWGGVPIVTELLTSFDQNVIYPARSTPDEVYAFIIEDLKKAEEMLAGYPVLTGRASQWAVKALLAKVYLEKGEWALAADKAAEVINSKQYSLTPQYSTIFTNENSSESIFEVQFDNVNQSVLAAFHLPVSLGGSRFFAPSDTLLKRYEAKDSLRKTTSVKLDKANTPYSTKYPRITTKDDNLIVSRLADVLLMRAEALAQLSYPSEEALGLLNQVRKRAGLTEWVPEDVPDQLSFLTALYRERQVELAFEGQRRFDLVRMSRQEAFREQALQALGISDPDRILLPIPRYDLDLNSNLEQNPGY
jgi:hypothetical protein